MIASSNNGKGIDINLNDCKYEYKYLIIIGKYSMYYYYTWQFLTRYLPCVCSVCLITIISLSTVY